MVLKKLPQDNTTDINEPLAIIGMNCQFPGLDTDIEDADAFYNLLLKGQSPIKEVPEDRWNINQYYDADRKKSDKIVSRLGGFLNNPHLFDADFFKISPAEAKQIDPQHRLFLEVAVRALNHANITKESLSGSKTGVYCGISSQDYSHLNYKDNIQFNEYTQIGAASSAAPGRLCHYLNLRGPSMTVDTACSSSLSALYVAATDLRTHQCNMAIVGGVHLNLCPENFIGLTKANMLSAKGHCSSFDMSADGFVRSEGCAVVIVKRLSDALRDKDTILALIKSIVMNHDGNEGSLVAPDMNAQIAMHQAVLEQAQITAKDIDYIETHGTGTVIGDSVEFNAIQAVHQGYHSQEKPLILGALKSTIGHTISSSGIASLIKVICTLNHEKIPPNLHYSTPNATIKPETIPARFPVQALDYLKQKNQKRCAQVSNFGFSGTNVSLVVEEAPELESPVTSVNDTATAPFLISANSPESLQMILTDFIPYLQHTSVSLSDICHTLINCRDHYKYRCAIRAKDKNSLIQKIQSAEYEIIKVSINAKPRFLSYTEEQLIDCYLSGANIRIEADNLSFNKADLPLYHFHRKPYWHESRKNANAADWLNGLLQKSKTQQEDHIKEKVAALIASLIHKEHINEHQDFNSLGLTPKELETLDHLIQECFAPLFKLPIPITSPHLNLAKLARHILSIIKPETVERQPFINVLNVEPIAVIGMSCRFPKAENIDAFLSLLQNGQSGMTDIPLERWDNSQYYDPDLNALGKLYIKQLGFIDNIKNFDADFFNVSPREAKFMSPQLRVFMETCFHALEDANLSLDLIKDSNTGVFVGVGTNEYPRVLSANGLKLEDLSIYFATGNVLNALAGRVAYAFDFHGPIQVIDTACSSSMTAIHNACLSLQAGDCDMAVAGGVNTLLTPESNITLSKARMLSPESRCKTFSADADGYARSEGCGVIVLKRLSTALRDKDTVLAVIKGTAINSDGKSGGFTVPNGTAQEELIRSALAKAKLSPGDIDYIEAHGTGTPLADPIEAHTLTKIFSDSHSQEHPLYISSVKTNIGHCESASGVAGIIKAILSLQTHQLFKHLNFKKLNPEIELSNAVIPLDTLDWKADTKLRCAGVSSFGFSGANAHIILQEAPKQLNEASPIIQEDFLLILSAKSAHSLQLLLTTYQRFLTNTQESFANICYTAATCRSHFLHRVAIKAKSAAEAAEQIAKKEYTIHSLKKIRDSSQPTPTLEQIQKAYENGFTVNWIEYYSSLGYSFKKVKLPLYEFDRKEYWIKSKDKLNDIPIPGHWCFQMQWQKQPCDTQNRAIQGRNWLLVGAKHLASDLQATGLKIFIEEDDIALDRLYGILFAEGLDTATLTSDDANIDMQERITKKLLHLVQSLDEQGLAPRLLILTTNAIAELPTGKLNLSNSPLIGLSKTLGLELPQFRTTLIDIDPSDSTNATQQIIAEMNYNHSKLYEHMVAYRDGNRMVSRLKKVPLIDDKIVISGKGRYLITGGTGGLGLVTAQALLSAGAHEVVIISRTVDKPELKTAIKKILIDFPSQSIQTLSVDVSDKQQVHQLLTELNADNGLKGIIHAAGVAIKAPLLSHKDDDVESVFSAKVKGAWYLHEYSTHCNLDFFVVYSSIAALFGSNKESVYSAANSFLDLLIAERQRLGLPGISIGWGPWGEVGMANKRSRNPGLKDALITNEQGHSLIKVLLKGQLSHPGIISPAYLKFMLDFVPKPLTGFYKILFDDLVLDEQTKTKETVQTNASPWLSYYLNMNKDQRLKACKDLLLGICKDILELASTDELDEDEGFFEIGLDSLMVAEMASELKKKLEPAMKIGVSIGFNYPSINQLARHIDSELNSQLMQKENLSSSKPVEEEAIAVIGMSCALPNAPDLQAFEYLLEQGLSGIKEIPLERWDNSLYYDANMDAPGKSYVNKMGFIDHIKDFDAHFFGISPREAKLMEPQQRLFLEHCYKAIEHANYPPDSLRGSLTGVFAGVGPNEYYALLEKSGFSNEELSAYSITGNVLNLIPGRVAYFFDFKGPSLSIDTACSSSLVALHYACQSLKNRETNYALAGGVNVLLMPESNVTLCKARALAADGQCKTFDARADGYARAEGCGVVLLKRLSDALNDKDTILAVIKASSVNNDGKAAGLTVPNGISQEEVMKTALRQSNLALEDISYIEAHGTGTPLGDPIEMQAINKVYGAHHTPENPLYVGTVKTNIGHLESASGIASVIKTILGLNNKRIYKILNFTHLNPNITLENTYIALDTRDWQSNSRLRCAGINAFGFSGTNAHVILQEFPQQNNSRILPTEQPHALVLSAKTSTSLQQLAQAYQHFLETTKATWADICFTAATCRNHYAHRLVLTAKNTLDAAQHLKKGRFSLSSEPNKPNYYSGHDHLDALVMDYLNCAPVDWKRYYQSLGDEFKKVLLPHYEFDRSEYWPDTKSKYTTSTKQVHPLLGQMLSMPGNEYLFTNHFDLHQLSYIKDHKVFNKVVVPATAYMEAGLVIARELFKSPALSIKNLLIERPLYPRQGQEIQFQVKPIPHGRYKIIIFAQHDAQWQKYAEMECQTLADVPNERLAIDELKSSFNNAMDLSQIYDHLSNRSLFYGKEFQVLHEGYVGANDILSRVTLTKETQTARYHYHPILLDGAIQSIVLKSMDASGYSTYVPYSLAHMFTLQEAPRTVWVHLHKRPTEQNLDLCFNIKIYTNTGVLIACLEELKLRKVTPEQFISYESVLRHLYHITWHKAQYKQHPQTALPQLWVITKDSELAKKRLGTLPYQLINDPNSLNDMQQKHILFLYEQSQFNELVLFCKKLFKSPPESFTLVTECAYAIHEYDAVNPYHTMAISFWNTFRNELNLKQNYSIDCDANSTLLQPLNCLFDPENTETQCAQREALFIPRLNNKILHINSEQHPKLFNSDANYLIIGGTGGLALPLIRYLMSRGVCSIHLTSRSQPAATLKALMDEARQKQVYITHHQINASNFYEMEGLIHSINQNPKPLRGVFHLAGVIEDGLIINLTPENIQNVLNAKMDSALILHQLTQNIPLDLFVLFSSSASILGAKGQANYAAANGFLDGLAHKRHHEHLPAIAINWGPFQNTGMTSNLSQAMQHHGFIPMEQNTLEVLDVLLTHPVTQIAPCPMDWNIYCKQVPGQALFTHLIKTVPNPDQNFLNSLKNGTKEECLTMLNQALCRISAEVLALDNINQISPKDNLFSMGLDSLMSLEIRNRIHDLLRYPKLSLPIEYFINSPTIEKIALEITNQLYPMLRHKSDNLPQIPVSEHPVPLCDFQYIFWVMNTLDYSFNIGMQIQIQGALNKEYVAQAFDLVVRQNSTFWIQFNKDEPVQKINKQGQFQLIVQDFSLTHDRNILQREFYKNLMRLILLSEQPLIKVYLYKINNDLHELHLLIPHIIVDDASCELVWSQFKSCYEQLVQGKTLTPITEKENFFNYVRHNNHHYEKNLKAKINFWQQYNKGFELLSFGKNYHLPDAAIQSQFLCHYPIPNHTLDQFFSWHKERNINITSGLVAACQIAFYKISRQNKIPVILIHNGREGSRFKSVVGLFSEYKRINLVLDVTQRFIECIQAIEQQIIQTAPYQKCSHFIKDLGFKNSKLDFSQLISYMINTVLLRNTFKKSQINSLIINYYLKYLSRTKTFKYSLLIKNKINQLFNLNIPMQKPDRLRVLISITPSLFVKEQHERRFAHLNYSYPSHFGCMDRPISNKTLWIYFSKNQHGEYILSINGPLTQECKDQISNEVNKIIAQSIKDDDSCIKELL
ncbi:SDR family NAD(P)-dependent oxidoreductase [Legionella worsleiensis]|uniref:Polyketide synthase, type I n=1 Tax=Legionella worsleiensis TaxID=45076 RepID=A0A0W1A5U1_9GAMM|nr:SDR family NAD(P)-dependent oxidoreductase [Legionella worsleiensis]KTD76738.1 polyketide synthase, type I [Legionella worsleiensis]STY30531.1 polyketide synthase, type I [Legionella worsleiensis]